MTLSELKSRYNLLRLACQMEVPIRCGGTMYNEAVELCYWFGGAWRTRKEVLSLKDEYELQQKALAEDELSRIATQIVAIEPSWVPPTEPYIPTKEQP